MCGSTGGLPFANVTRADLNGSCPDNLKPCLPDAAANVTLCYPESDLSTQCPITDILLVDHSELSQYTDQGYDYRKYNSSSDIVFSKTKP